MTTQLVITVAGLTLAGALVAPVGVRAQQPGAPSTKMVAFGDEKPVESPAPTATAPPESVTTPARVTMARLIPVSPRIELPAKTGLGGPAFSARPAVATRWTVNSPFGVRHDPMTGVPRMHTGVDLQGTYGESVGASMSGTIAFAGQRSGYGNLVVVDHGHGISTFYAHLSEFAVATGSRVEAGQVIGYVGTTGRSTGPHLHYEVRANGRPLDPSTLIAVDGDRLSIDGVALAPTPDGASGPLPKAPESTTILANLTESGTMIVDGTALQVDWE